MIRAVSLLLLILTVIASPLAAADRPVYELRVYTCEPGKLDALHARFREHTTKLFEKHGMKNIAYFVPADGPTTETTLIYLLEHASREAAEASWTAFRDDPVWKQVAAQSQQEHGKILATAPEATFLTAVDYSPPTGPVDPAKTYELRVYVAHPDKLADLHARFRNHTDTLFQKHGMKSVGYWSPIDPPKSQTTLIYIVQHDTREAAAASWKAFGADPDWQAAKAASEQAGPLLSERPQSTFLRVVDYSPRPAAAPKAAPSSAGN